MSSSSTRFHPLEAAALSQLSSEGSGVITVADGKPLKCTVQKPPPGQPFALVKILTPDSGFITGKIFNNFADLDYVSN